MDFSHLQKLEIADKTAEFNLVYFSPEPVLTLRPATEANKPYFNALLKQSRSSVAAIQRGNVTERQIAENRDRDRRLFAAFVVVSWDNVTDSNGEQVPYTPENCKAYLEALPDWIFDEIRNFATNTANFFGDPIDIEATAKNSESG